MPSTRTAFCCRISILSSSLASLKLWRSGQDDNIEHFPTAKQIPGIIFVVAPEQPMVYTLGSSLPTERGFFVDGKLIVLSGVEGCGKTTQAKMLADVLKARGHKVLLTKEPGDERDQVCQDIRKVLLKKKHRGKFLDRTELLLFFGERAQHVEYVLRPALQQGNIAVCDRFQADTAAYQLYARGACTIDEFMFIGMYAARGLRANFNCLIDIDPEIGLKRNVAAGKKDRFEAESLEFHRRVRDGFLTYYPKFVMPNEWQKLDGTLPVANLHKEIVEAVTANLEL